MCAHLFTGMTLRTALQLRNVYYGAPMGSRGRRRRRTGECARPMAAMHIYGMQLHAAQSVFMYTHGIVSLHAGASAHAYVICS